MSDRLHFKVGNHHEPLEYESESFDGCFSFQAVWPFFKKEELGTDRPRFNHLIGPAKTKQLLILAEPVNTATAERWGLVDYISTPGEALNNARELARKVAAMPPVPVRMAKQAINVCASSLDHAASYMDADQFLLTQGTDDALEGVTSFFEKRPAKFTGN